MRGVIDQVPVVCPTASQISRRTPHRARFYNFQVLLCFYDPKAYLKCDEAMRFRRSARL